MKELRIAEIRAVESADNTAMKIYGRAILFDVATQIETASGSYTEIIKRGALDSADLSDVRLLYNHDTNKVPLARSPKTMSLTVDKDGLLVEATLADTAETRSVYEAVKRQDLSGMSFAFTVPDDGETYDPKTNTRTINKIKKVYECSIVVFPAYPETSVEARTKQTAIQKNYIAKQSALMLIESIFNKEV